MYVSHAKKKKKEVARDVDEQPTSTRPSRSIEGFYANKYTYMLNSTRQSVCTERPKTHTVRCGIASDKAMYVHRHTSCTFTQNDEPQQPQSH